jgi:hypothetical protein
VCEASHSLHVRGHLLSLPCAFKLPSFSLLVTQLLLVSRGRQP